MNQSKENLEIIEGTRNIKGCENFTEDECMQVWEDVEWMLDMDYEDWDE